MYKSGNLCFSLGKDAIAQNNYDGLDARFKKKLACVEKVIVIQIEESDTRLENLNQHKRVKGRDVYIFTDDLDLSEFTWHVEDVPEGTQLIAFNTLA